MSAAALPQSDGIAGVGHNMPPDEFITLSGQVQDLKDEAKNHLDGVAVTTQGQCDALDVIRQTAIDLEKALDAARKAERKEADEIIARVQAKYNPLLETAKRIKEAARAGAAQWKRDLLAQQAKEAARVADEARIAREAAEQLAQAARQAGDLNAIEEADAQLANADVLGRMAKKAAKLPSTGLRTYWIGEIEDYAAYWEWLRANRLSAAIDFMNEQVRRDVAAGERVIPGVRIRSEKR